MPAALYQKPWAPFGAQFPQAALLSHGSPWQAEHKCTQRRSSSGTETDWFVSSALRLLPVFHYTKSLQPNSALNTPMKSKDTAGGHGHLLISAGSGIFLSFFVCHNRSTIQEVQMSAGWFIFRKTRENNGNEVLHLSLSAFSLYFISAMHFFPFIYLYVLIIWSMTICSFFATCPLLPGIGEKGESRALLLRRHLSSSWSSSSNSSMHTLLLKKKKSTTLSVAAVEQLWTGSFRMPELPHWVADIKKKKSSAFLPAPR